MSMPRGRPKLFFEDEDDTPYFYCQSCSKLCSKKKEENWVRIKDIVIRICNKCYRGEYQRRYA